MAGRTYEQETTSTGPAALGLAISMGVPVLLILAGVASLGFGAVDWASAIVWGVVGTAAFTLFGLMGQKMGMTEMDILDILGSAAAEPGTGKAKGIGAVVHHMNGPILAVAGVYGVNLVGLPMNWATGLLWGAVLTALALVMLSSLAPFHPAIRAGKLRDPGTAATNYGKMTPMGSLMGHLVFGLVLGLGYQLLPVL